MEKLTLVSTVVAPSFDDAKIVVKSVSLEDVPDLLGQVGRNLCGHPLTSGILKEVFPELPEPVREFWDGTGRALAARPKGGVRSASQNGDTEVSLADLEFALFWIE